MTRPLTDRERCQVLEARVAELEAELASWRANECDERSADADVLRQEGMKTLLRSAIGKAGPPGLQARLALLLMDRPGRLLTYAWLGANIATTREACPHNAAKVALSYLRKALRVWRLADGVQTVRGRGVLMHPDTATQLSRRLSLATVGA